MPPVENHHAATGGSADEPTSLHLLNPNGAAISMCGGRNARTGQSEQSDESGTKSRRKSHDTPRFPDDSQTGIGGADFDETMTNQLGDVCQVRRCRRAWPWCASGSQYPVRPLWDGPPLQGDDYPLEYYEDGYPKRPACLDRRIGRLKRPSRSVDSCTAALRCSGSPPGGRDALPDSMGIGVPFFGSPPVISIILGANEPCCSGGR